VLPNVPPDPLGPATIRYVGRLVLTLDSSGTTLGTPVFHGQQTSICAALAP